MKFMTMNEVANTLSVSRITVHRLINRGEIKSLKVGRAVRIPEESLKDYVDRNLKGNVNRVTQKEISQITNKCGEYVFEVIIEPDEDRYHVYCPLLKGCRTWGHTEEEAYNNIQEAVELYLEALIEEDETIPGIGIIKNIQDKHLLIGRKNDSFYNILFSIVY